MMRVLAFRLLMFLERVSSANVLNRAKERNRTHQQFPQGAQFLNTALRRGRTLDDPRLPQTHVARITA